MTKKLIVLALAVAAFAAMVIPASASALTLTYAAGEIAPNNWIVGTSTNTKITHTAIGDLFCPHVAFAAEVATNSGSLITASNGAFGPLANCEAGGGAELTITEPRLKHLESTGNDQGTGTISLTADVGPFKCPYEGVIPFTYETGFSHNTLSISGQMFSPFYFCEEEEGEGEPAIFEGTYSLTTTAGSSVWIEPGA